MLKGSKTYLDRRLGSLIFWGAVFALLLLLFSTIHQGIAEERSKSLLMVTTSDGESRLRSLERQLVTSLRLVLDGVSVREFSVESSFLELAVSDQLDQISESADSAGALAAIWLEESGSQMIVLRVVSMKTGKLLAASVVGAEQAEIMSELALLVHELIGEHGIVLRERLSDGGTAERDGGALDAGIADGGKEASDEDLSEETKETGDDKKAFFRWMSSVKALSANPANWRLGVGIEFLSGLSEQVGGSIRVGEGIMAEWWILDSLFLRPRLFVGAGPLGSAEGFQTSGFWLSFGIDIGYLWESKGFYYGPFIGIHAPWTSVKVDYNAQNTEEFSWWAFRGSAGGELRWEVTQLVYLMLDASIGICAPREEKRLYFQFADGNDPSGDYPQSISETFRSSWFDFSATLAIGFALDELMHQQTKKINQETR